MGNGSLDVRLLLLRGVLIGGYLLGWLRMVRAFRIHLPVF